MYKRDLLKAEIENLSKILAQLIQLKLDGNLADAKLLFDDTMKTQFGLPAALTDDTTSDAFKNWLDTVELSAEKLDSLSEFLYYELGTTSERNAQIAPKLNLIYNLLSEKYKMVHLVNLHRQKTIQQYI